MKNRKNKYIIIGAMIVIIPVILCVIGYFIYNNSHKPEPKWNEYVSLLKDKNYENMYELLDSSAKAKISKEDFIARNKKIYEGIEAKDINVNITGTEKKDGGYIISYDTDMDTIAGKLNFPNKVKLIKEIDKGYTIEWSSNIIFPDLNDDDKVRVETIKSKRGNISDRNGELLATDAFTSSVGIVPGKLGEDKEANINKIAQILEISTDNINKSLSADYVKDDMFVPIKDLTYGSDKIAKLLEINGVMVKDKESRVYPLGMVTSHLTGYVQAINGDELKEKKDEEYNEHSMIGKTGLEKMFEDKLRGIDGSEIYIQNNLGEKKKTIIKKEVKNGSDIKLTIDVNMQRLLYNQLEQDKGLAVAMNPDNGEIMALVSTPAYDPNDFIIGISNDKWNSLNNDPKKPLFNRFQSTFAPGSAFKPITALIGVDTGKIDPNEVKNISGSSWQNNSSWGNYYVTRVHSYETPNLKNALVYSDNIYFAMAAIDIGKDKFKEELSNFGFGEKIPCDYALYNSQISSDGEFSSEIQLADSGYGQGGILVNPIHLTSLYTMFENQGNIVKPKIIIDDSNSEKSIWKENAVKKEAADTVLQGLIQVVEDPAGTGHAARVNGLTIAGKTGTAEIKMSQDDTSGTELGWFVGMTTNKAPNNLLVTMMVEDVKDRGGSGYVVPKVREALQTVK